MSIKELAEQLIAIPSITSSIDQCEKVIDYVESLFKKTGYISTRFSCNNHHSICISKRTTLDFDLLFLGHLDVVPAPSESLFLPKTINGWLYGRGSADMKGSCASMIQLFLNNFNNPVFDNFGLIFTTDEEQGGFDGIGYLINDKGLKAKTVFNPDGPATGKGFTPCIEEKGGLFLKITANGKVAHGSQPWNGINAIDKLFEDLETIKKLYDYATCEEDWKISLNISKFNGGEAINSVAQKAISEIDIRFPRELDATMVLKKLKSSVKNSQIETLMQIEPVFIADNNPILQKLISSLKQHNLEANVIKETGSSDARWFSKQNSNIILMIPETSPFHISDEAVNIKSLDTFLSVMNEFCLNYYSV